MSPSARGRRWPEIAASVAFFIALLLLHGVPIGHDAVWQLWIGRQLSHGSQLYTDILELNPPLWFWMAAALVHLAELARMPAAEMLRLSFFAAMAVSLSLVGFLQRHQPAGARLILYATLLLAFTAVVLPDFAQREHFVLIVSAPYVALIAARNEGRQVPAWLSAMVAVLAASGLALKHYFAIVPIALEVWLFLTSCKRKLWRTEVAVLALCAVLYIGAILVFAAEYLHTMIPVIRLSYFVYGMPPVFQLLVAAVPLTVLAALGCVLRKRRPTPLGQAAWVAALGFLIGYFLQEKGWQYHSLPALGMLLMVIGAECAGVDRAQLMSRRERPALVCLACVVVIAVIAGVRDGPYRNEKEPESLAALTGLRRGDTVMMLAANPTTIWPMVEDQGLLWPSRHMIFWMLPAIVNGWRENNYSPELQALARDLRQQTLADLVCHPPRRILVDDPSAGAAVPNRFDYLNFLRAEPALSDFLDRYRRGPTYGRFATFDLADPAGIVPTAGCRAIH